MDSVDSVDVLSDLATVFLTKGKCSLNQSRVDPFVGRVAKNNSDRHKIHEIFLTNCFVLVITLL